MIGLGRVSSGIFVLAVLTLVLIASLRPDLMHVGSIHVVDWVGLAIYVAGPVAWISAILHWARYFPREGHRVVWGLVVVVGFLPGAVIYWFWGANRLRA